MDALNPMGNNNKLSVFDRSVCLAVHSYMNSNNKVIQVIVVNKDSLVSKTGKINDDLGSIVLHYDFSFLHNYYNGCSFRMIHPHDAITKVGHFHKDLISQLNLTKVEADEVHKMDPRLPKDLVYMKLNNYHKKLIKRIDKYASRGFVVVGKQPPRDLDTPYNLW